MGAMHTFANWCDQCCSREDPRARRRPAGYPPAQGTNSRYPSAQEDLSYRPADMGYRQAQPDAGYPPADPGYRQPQPQPQPDEGYRQPQPQRSSTVASIPIIEPRQRAAPVDQDADGNFGDRQVWLARVSRVGQASWHQGLQQATVCLHLSFLSPSSFRPVRAHYP